MRYVCDDRRTRHNTCVCATTTLCDDDALRRQAKGSMELVHNRCLFADKQMVRVQETPDEIPQVGRRRGVMGGAVLAAPRPPRAARPSVTRARAFVLRSRSIAPAAVPRDPAPRGW